LKEGSAKWERLSAVREDGPFKPLRRGGLPSTDGKGEGRKHCRGVSKKKKTY